MLLIGSRALVENNPHLAATRVCSDWDYIATLDQVMAWIKQHKDNLQFAIPRDEGKYYHCRLKDGTNYEFELAWEGTSAKMLLDSYASNCTAIDDDLYLIKMCHRYKKNSVHFLKTMQDIKTLRKLLGKAADHWMILGSNIPIIEQRIKESYDYGHPKLNVTSKEFFNADGIDYVYDHDSIHLTVAICQRERVVRTGGASVPGKLISYGKTEIMSYPAYTFYMKDGSEVMTSKEKFMSVPESIRLHGVYEESCVLALERSQIPHGLDKEGGPTARWSFEKALEKVCTSVTSGWFREYAWENHAKVMELYERLGENDYVERFLDNTHWLKAYEK